MKRRLNKAKVLRSIVLIAIVCALSIAMYSRQSCTDTTVVDNKIVTTIPVVRTYLQQSTPSSINIHTIHTTTCTSTHACTTTHTAVSVSRGYSNDDLYLLAKLIHCEAGVESYSGKLAVGTVVMNRVAHSNTRLYGGRTIERVVYKHGQFSCVSNKALWAEQPEKDDYKAAEQVLHGYRSFSSDIVYYWNPSLSEGVSDVHVVSKIGHHVFGKEA
jgi:spore germination cell wall hydrolase CwlJ-like protein